MFPRQSPSDRLRSLVTERSDYIVMVGIPLPAPLKWARVLTVNDGMLQLEGIGSIPINKVTAFVVTYPSGQLVDHHTGELPFPRGVTGLTVSKTAAIHRVKLADLRTGERLIRIQYGQSTSRPGQQNYYSTTLNNISQKRIKINHFGGYTPVHEDVWELNNLSGDFYSAAEFQEWYGVGRDQWILPGMTVCDGNNYGAPPLLWVYYGVTESDEQFVAGAAIEVKHANWFELFLTQFKKLLHANG